MGGDETPAGGTKHDRLLSSLGVALNCLSAGSIQLFPLVSVPLAKQLHITAAQTATLGTAAILGQYSSAVFLGKIADLYGPGVVSALGGVFFGVAYGLLSWRFKVVVQQAELGEHEWIFFAAMFLLTGAGTAASYFSAIIASTKSFPARHAGLAIGVPCALLGLSPLFLSPLASFFTSEVTQELDPGNWLLFLAVLLTVVNVFGGCVLKVVPWFDEDEDDEPSTTSEPPSSDPTERTTLLPTSANAPLPSDANTSQSLHSLLADPTFWLFGVMLVFSLGPCEMVMASLGAIVESTLGIKIQRPDKAPVPFDTRALGLRRLHVQVISICNTSSRLIVGAVSDWLSYSSHPPHHLPPTLPHSAALPRRVFAALQWRFRRPPRVSRLAFALVACLVLAGSFVFVALQLNVPAQLWLLSAPVGTSYGVLFTVAPAIVRSVYPVVDFGRNFGILSLAGGAGAALFTPALGVLVDRAARKQGSEICYGSDCWHDIFLLSAMSVLASAVMLVVLWRRWWRGKV